MYDSSIIYPKLCIVEVSRYCNFSCSMCPHQSISSELQGNMSFETFCRIVDETYQYIKAYQLYWVGEPFLNSDIFKMIGYLRSKTKAQIIVSTNGSLLSHEMSYKILNSGINKLIIDIDSGDSEEVYLQVRPGGNYSKLIDEVEQLIALNTNQQLDIILQFLHFKCNTEQLPIFLNRWGNKGCTLRVDWIDSWANQLPFLFEIAAEISPYFNEKRSACSDIWNRIKINYSGDVNLCCHDYKGTYCFGNVNQTPIIEIWNSSLIKSIRSNQLCGHYEGICENCIEWAKEEEYKEFFDEENN